jgi:hypothetical protein
MATATAKPSTLGQGFASAMSPWQPRPFTSPFAQASSMGPSQQGPPPGSRPRPGPGGVSMPAPKPIGVPVTGPNGVRMPGMQMDGLTPQAFPRPTVGPSGAPMPPTPGIGPGLQPPAPAKPDANAERLKKYLDVRTARRAKSDANRGKNKTLGTPGPGGGVSLPSTTTMY